MIRAKFWLSLIHISAQERCPEYGGHLPDQLRNHRQLRILPVRLGRILQIIGTAFEWAFIGNFHAAVQDFRIGIPGILIQWFGGYALLKAIAKL